MYDPTYTSTILPPSALSTDLNTGYRADRGVLMRRRLFGVLGVLGDMAAA